MDQWQHVNVHIDRTPRNEQLVLTPHQHDVEAELRDIQPRNVVAVLDDLGSQGWELVSVRDDGFWLKRRKLNTAGEVHLY